MEAEQIRHIHIRVGVLALDYVAPIDQADDVARVLSSCHAALEVSVTIDDDVREGLPPLPCSTLWQ
ncbi:hypothetical protein [Nocardia sp. NPDC005366]|uniref:hypothetical protein n=1 Tax=Nocardia sp. NPDC005366 TaxID=3156878 RepID=UPI0033A31827